MDFKVTTPEQTIWLTKNGSIEIIDQRHLPHQFVVEEITSVASMCTAISDMHVRGAPLLGVCGAFGMYLAVRESTKEITRLYIEEVAQKIIATRPTAVNLAWGVQRAKELVLKNIASKDLLEIVKNEANRILDLDIATCYSIGQHGLKLIEEISKEKGGKPVNILTHCNAGWLACVKYGTATSAIYLADQKAIRVHVWVDETRPRNQGASLTAWELKQAKIPHTIIADNTGGHLMQNGMVDLVIVGTDRTARNGDVANKIGTYLKALAANDNKVPFYVALPSFSIDWSIKDGKQIPIEERDEREVKYISGLIDGEIKEVLLTPAKSKALNYGFDVTPARLVTALITERGICKASEEGLAKLFPEYQMQ